MADGNVQDRANFKAMTESTAEDWAAIVRAGAPHRGKHVDRILAQMEMLRGDEGGFNVDRLEHSLQTATRAHRAGRDEGQDRQGSADVAADRDGRRYQGTLMSAGRWDGGENTA